MNTKVRYTHHDTFSKVLAEREFLPFLLAACEERWPRRTISQFTTDCILPDVSFYSWSSSYLSPFNKIVVRIKVPYREVVIAVVQRARVLAKEAPPLPRP